MITASMHTENAGESLSALRFGARASLVQNMARQNVAENVPGFSQVRCYRIAATGYGVFRVVEPPNQMPGFIYVSGQDIMGLCFELFLNGWLPGWFHDIPKYGHPVP